jgi:hypothetical protein
MEILAVLFVGAFAIAVGIYAIARVFSEGWHSGRLVAHEKAKRRGTTV